MVRTNLSANKKQLAKRFTDTNKYKKPFFRSIPGAYKLLWDFLYHDCDHAGIWIVDFKIAQMYIGEDMEINQKSALYLFNEDETRIIELDGGKKWFIPSFITFQYTQLSKTNRAHLKVIQILNSFGLLNTDLTVRLQNKPLTSPLQVVKEQEEEQLKEEEQEQSLFEENWKSAFDEIWLEQKCKIQYPKIDLVQKLKDFRFKCDSAPTEYHCRDRDGLRLGFLKTLTSPTTSTNGTIKNTNSAEIIKPRTYADKL